jgi:flagellar protein FliJ
MPRPFRFSLQRVLDYREQLEEEAKLELAKAQRAYQSLVARVRSLRETIDAHEKAMYQGERITPRDMWLWRAYRERLDTDLQQAELEMLQQAKVVNRARRALVNRAKDRRLLEKLKQNKMVRHVHEQAHSEQKENDEIATLRYQRDAF